MSSAFANAISRDAGEMTRLLLQLLGPGTQSPGVGPDANDLGLPCSWTRRQQIIDSSFWLWRRLGLTVRLLAHMAWRRSSGCES